MLTYGLDLALSNKNLEVITECLESKIFDEKVEVLFSLVKSKTNKALAFSVNILGPRHAMITSKYFLNRTESIK